LEIEVRQVTMDPWGVEVIDIHNQEKHIK